MDSEKKKDSGIQEEKPVSSHTETKEADDAEIAQKVGKLKKHVRVRNVFTVLLAVVLGIYAVIGVTGLRVLNNLLKTKPELNVNDFISQESTRIYDTDGNLITEVGAFYRENITYEDCPESLVDAFLAIEDSRFFTHNGFDIPRFISSAASTLSGEDVQGGSTFTMQLVKNTYFSVDDINGGTERKATIEYKVQQIALAIELEKQLNKKQIFELYLNKLNFGNRVRGVQKAAEYYFGKNVNELNLDESALLAGIINLPNRYNPYAYLDYATTRRNEVLNMMLMHGYITEEQCELAKSVRVEDELVGEQSFNVESNQYSQYLDVVIAEAQELTGHDPVTTGMDIYTAMIPTVQNEIEAIENGQTEVPWYNDNMQTAIISVNNTNGEIVGIGGGRNYAGGSRLLNRATDQPKQPGSSIKPILDYALAFEWLGYSADEIVIDKPYSLPGESRVLRDAQTENYRGDLRIKDALFHSLNIPAVMTLNADVTAKGTDAVISYLQSIGFTNADQDSFNLQWAIGGSTCEATVKTMAGAHAAMINLGVYNEPHTIRKVVSSNDEIFYPENQNRRVLSSGSAYLVDELTKYNVDHSAEEFQWYRELIRDYPVYAKTGTSDWGDAGLSYGIPSGAQKDKWMIASSANYTNAVWLGYDKLDYGTYITNWEDNLNQTGKINRLLLDAEEAFSDSRIYKGVEKPSDVRTVTYIDGTYPHVDEGTGNGKTITSMISATGLSNKPLVNGKNYAGNKPYMSTMDASISPNGMLYLNWNAPNGCSGFRDISLINDFNKIYKYGTCTVSVDYAYQSANSVFHADIYENDQLLGSIKSNNGEWQGFPANFEGNIKVCGYYMRNGRTSNTVCTDAGYYDYHDHPEYYSALIDQG